jgi:hypothetical protein
LPLKQDFTIAVGDPDGGAGCEWEDITSGFRVCQITNPANPAT